jgi:hypothetical protein
MDERLTQLHERIKRLARDAEKRDPQIAALIEQTRELEAWNRQSREQRLRRLAAGAMIWGVRD